MPEIDVKKAKELRDRAVCSGITWNGDPHKEGRNWCFPFKPVGDEFGIQALVIDRELNSAADELRFVSDIEFGVGRARISTDYNPGFSDGDQGRRKRKTSPSIAGTGVPGCELARAEHDVGYCGEYPHR